MARSSKNNEEREEWLLEESSERGDGGRDSLRIDRADCGGHCGPAFGRGSECHGRPTPGAARRCYPLAGDSRTRRLRAEACFHGFAVSGCSRRDMPQQPMPLPPTVAPGSPASTGTGQAGQTYPGLPTSPTRAVRPELAVRRPWHGLSDKSGCNRFWREPRRSSRGTAADAGVAAGDGAARPVDRALSNEHDSGSDVASATRAGSPSSAGRYARQQAVLDYSAPSAYSPYMNLFRGDTASRGVNNYYSYVKPALDQQRQDLTANREIQGLQDAARYGAQAPSKWDSGPATSSRATRRRCRRRS